MVYPRTLHTLPPQRRTCPYSSKRYQFLRVAFFEHFSTTTETRVPLNGHHRYLLGILFFQVTQHIKFCPFDIKLNNCCEEIQTCKMLVQGFELMAFLVNSGLGCHTCRVEHVGKL